MEELVRAGLVRSIGVCNYNCGLLRDLLSYASIRPTVLQIERHPLLCQEKLVRFCREEVIAVTGFSPLGAQSYFSLGMANPSESLLIHPIVGAIAIDMGNLRANPSSLGSSRGDRGNSHDFENRATGGKLIAIRFSDDIRGNASSRFARSRATIQ